MTSIKDTSVIRAPFLSPRMVLACNFMASAPIIDVQIKGATLSYHHIYTHVPWQSVGVTRCQL